MKIFDMHIHAQHAAPCPDKLLKEMDKAGVYGGCIFSTRPPESDREIGRDFDYRLKELTDWCSPAPDRLFPVMWVHPYEENIIEKVKKAADSGVCGFKIICTDFYIYEEKSLALLRAIAALDKPVFFHTGILWDGKVSSEYNRPLNFEALLDIEGLRFSMGHCSWPWIDECIALYGKFMNSPANGKKPAEMFFDLTPGTPEIYRRELLEKLFTIGYDVENNLLFGTDTFAHAYNSDWCRSWLETDRKIMDSLGVAKRVREKMYCDNLMRFLGKTKEEPTHLIPTYDNSSAWCCRNDEVLDVIKGWYDRLALPKEYKTEFSKALATVPVSDAIEIATYDTEETDGKRNLLSYLFMCEALKERYKEKGISEKILLDTLSDISIWLDVWSEEKGEMYLGELSWLKRHLEMRLFRLGRLQFCMAESEHDCPEFSLKKGDPVIEVHIPADGALTQEECEKSFAMAREFFQKYYPEYEYKYFTCHSWLLDPTLSRVLPDSSNIIRFRDMFKNAANDDSDAILRYVFKWNTTARNLKYAPVTSSLAEKVKKEFLSGTQFHETLGIIEK